MSDSDPDSHPDPDQPPFPIRGYHQGEPIPDLSAIPEGEWIAVLTPLSASGRNMAVDAARTRVDPELIGQLMIDVARLSRVESERRMRVLHGGAPPAAAPAADAAAAADRTTGQRQVSFRLSPAQYTELEQAGQAVGLRPAPLARMLVQNGVRRMLYVERSQQK
jgi:hypothetical protein